MMNPAPRPLSPVMPMVNALTIDVEDYFHVHAFSKAIDRCDWDSCACSVEECSFRILDLLDEFDTRATFFVLGWVAERYPGLVREVSRRGHEVASHGYRHALVHTQSRREFCLDIRWSKQVLEKITGERVLGYRAPTYSIRPDTLWALECLQQEGFLYDSSIYPIRHDYYGLPQAPRFPFVIQPGEHEAVMAQLVNPVYAPLNGTEISRDGSGLTGAPQILERTLASLENGALIEWPLSTVRWAGRNFPCAGGGYFRLLPYGLTRWCIESLNRSGRPAIFYIHPWEFNPCLPKVKGATRLQRFRTYLNLDKTEEKIRRLLTDFRFAPVRDLLPLPAPRSSHPDRTLFLAPSCSSR